MSTSRTPQSGFGLIDVLIATLVFGVTTVAVMGVATLSVRLSADGERQTVALNLAREKIEYVRTLAYEQVGIQPAGVLPAQETVTRNQQPYQVLTNVVYVDDPKTPVITQDFIKVRVAVQWTAPSNQTRAAVLVTLVSKAGAGLAGTPAASPGVGICTPLVAGAGTAVHQYYDNNTWQNVGPPGNTGEVVELFYNPGDGNLYAGTSQGRVYVSVLGKGWYDAGVPGDGGAIIAITVGPLGGVAVATGSHVFAQIGGYTGSWVDLGAPGGEGKAVTALGRAGELLYAGSNQALYQYGSPGNWIQQGVPLASAITAFGPAVDGLYFGLDDGALYKVQNEVRTPLNALDGPIRAIEIQGEPGGGFSVYVAKGIRTTGAAVYKGSGTAFTGWSMVGTAFAGIDITDLTEPLYAGTTPVHVYDAVNIVWKPLAPINNMVNWTVRALEFYTVGCINP